MVRRLLTPKWLLLHALAIVAMLTCFGLSWWQWDRSQSATGSLQNLGYALQWPLFGLFIPFVYWRMTRLERDQVRKPAPAPAEATITTAAKRRSPTEWRDRYRSAEPQDAVFVDYNHYLAELNAHD